jgi:hypothetical protein
VYLTSGYQHGLKYTCYDNIFVFPLKITMYNSLFIILLQGSYHVTFKNSVKYQGDLNLTVLHDTQYPDFQLLLRNLDTKEESKCVAHVNRNIDTNGQFFCFRFLCPVPVTVRGDDPLRVVLISGESNNETGFA